MAYVWPARQHSGSITTETPPQFNLRKRQCAAHLAPAQPHPSDDNYLPALFTLGASVAGTSSPSAVAKSI